MLQFVYDAPSYPTAFCNAYQTFFVVPLLSYPSIQSDPVGTGPYSSSQPLFYHGNGTAGDVIGVIVMAMRFNEKAQVLYSRIANSDITAMNAQFNSYVSGSFVCSCVTLRSCHDSHVPLGLRLCLCLCSPCS